MAKKARAWSNLKGTVPDDPSQTELTPWMQEVLGLVDARESATMTDLAKEWAELNDAEDAAAAAAAERNKKYRALEILALRQLEKVKEASGQDMWRGEGMVFSPKFSPRPVIEDKAALEKWIRDSGRESLLTLPHTRLESIIKEALDPDLAAILTPDQRAELKPGEPASGAPPPGVKVFLQTTVNNTDRRVKKEGSEDPPNS